MLIVYAYQHIIIQNIHRNNTIRKSYPNNIKMEKRYEQASHKKRNPNSQETHGKMLNIPSNQGNIK